MKMCLALTSDHDTPDIIAARWKLMEITNQTVVDGWLSLTYWVCQVDVDEEKLTNSEQRHHCP